MEKKDFKKMVKGWFIGDFEPSVFKTKDFEVAYKEYKKNDFEKRHTHKVAYEFTLVIYGKVKMNGQIFKKNDIVVMKPGESTDFLSITNSKTIVVKTPSVIGDKYFA